MKLSKNSSYKAPKIKIKKFKKELTDKKACGNIDKLSKNSEFRTLS